MSLPSATGLGIFPTNSLSTASFSTSGESIDIANERIVPLDNATYALKSFTRFERIPSNNSAKSKEISC